MRSSILPIKYSDFDLNFIPNGSNDIPILKNEKAISMAIKNLVLTGFSERLFYPDKGCGVYSLLFDPMSPMVETLLSEHIKTVLYNWEQRIVVTDINVYANYDENRYDVTMYYKITNSNDLMQIDFFLELIR